MVLIMVKRNKNNLNDKGYKQNFMFFLHIYWIQLSNHRNDCTTIRLHQIQAEASQGVQGPISIPLQVCIPAGEHQSAVNFPLCRGGSATDALPVSVPVRITITLPFSLPVLGWAQVRGALDDVCSSYPSSSDGPESVACQGKISCFDMNVTSPEPFVRIILRTVLVLCLVL